MSPLIFIISTWQWIQLLLLLFNTLSCFHWAAQPDMRVQKWRGKCYFTREQQSQDKNKATHQCFLEFCSLKFQESCRKSSMRQQAVPLGRVVECEWVHRANMAVADRRTESAPHSSGVNHPLYPPRMHAHTHTHANIQKVSQRKKTNSFLSRFLLA